MVIDRAKPLSSGHTQRDPPCCSCRDLQEDLGRVTSVLDRIVRVAMYEIRGAPTKGTVNPDNISSFC
jgi:hypothetical protein